MKDVFLYCIINNTLKTSNAMNLIVNQYFISIFTSLVSALIFWIVFDYLPKKHRRDKLKPKMEYELYCIYIDLFQYFDRCLRHCKTSPSYFQSQITAGILTIDDFEIGLYNKCLSINDQYDKNRDKLIPIGDILKNISNNIKLTSNGLFLFNQELTPDEILLLRNILIKVDSYSYESHSVSYANGQKYVSQNPTIHYMAENIFDLYVLYIRLQEKVYKFKKIDKVLKHDLICSIINSKAFKLRTLKQYKEILKLSKKYSYLFVLQIEAKYKLGYKEDSIESLKKYLTEEHEKLIYLRGYFKYIYSDENIKKAMIEVRSENEYNDMVQCILEEQKEVFYYIEQNKKLKDYYANKSDR